VASVSARNLYFESGVEPICKGMYSDPIE